MQLCASSKRILLVCILICFSICSPLSTTKAWPRYLVEFRGLYNDFRINELEDSLSFVFNSDSLARKLISEIDYAMLDEQFEGQPCCGYINLPNDTIANLVSSRCGCIRTIIEVWGDGKTTDEVCEQTLANFDSIVRPSFPVAHSPEQREANSWKVQFRRFGRGGRSGLDPQEKRAFLRTFDKVLTNLHGDVNLTHPSNELIYLEDFHSFHSMNIANSSLNRADYRPLRAIFGRVAATGSEIQTDFDLRKRPFLGTTTMAPMPAQLCAAAARLGASSLVLDPFCGTGSILIAAAALGCQVVGSDIDADCLGLGDPADRDERSKNVRFRRYGGANQGSTKGERLSWDQQTGLCTKDNFVYYGLDDKLHALLARDIRDWLPEAADDTQDNRREPRRFSAIITDPPYSRREKVQNAQVECADSAISTNGDEETDPANAVVATLFDVAKTRLEIGGKLVFWYPTDAFVKSEDVISLLEKCMSRSALGGRLELSRVTPEKLHDKLWRWLVIYVLVDSECVEGVR